MIQQALQKLVERKHLSRAEMAEVFAELMSGSPTPAQAGAFLAALRLKGETVEEITGAAQAVRERLEPVRVSHAIFVDTCGTGGDGQNTFNISTTAAFVVAAAGVPVAKHGNRSVSSRCGSADVLTALGVDVAAPVELIERCIADIGIGFLFAPRHHPAFKAVAEIRRELGVRTLFNLLGPLANPAGARHQVMGVFEERWVPIVGRVLSSLGAAHAFVVHGQGLDEIAVTGSTTVCEVQGSEVYDFEVSPEELGVGRWNLNALLGGDAAKNAAMLRDVLSGQKGAPRDAVIANAAAALVAGEAAEDLLAGARAAADAIDRGRALAKLQDLIRMTQARAA
jgi:anthranilate phosphoribosyltransferase